MRRRGRRQLAPPAPAALIGGPGETMDFEFRAPPPGILRLDVQQRTGIWKTALPIKVER